MPINVLPFSICSKTRIFITNMSYSATVIVQIRTLCIRITNLLYLHAYKNIKRIAKPKLPTLSPASFIRVISLAHRYECFSSTSVPTYEAPHCQTPEDHNLKTHLRSTIRTRYQVSHPEAKQEKL